jgi:anaerobic ribonucleoside-triphosphate reductase activating protein
MLKFTQENIVFNEVPNEISLCYSISGCQKYCKGCHSPELWEEQKNHSNLSPELLEYKIKMYQGMITAVCFLGGDWRKNDLINVLKISKNSYLKTCLYSNRNTLEEVEPELLELLDFIKIGEYKQELGGINSLSTNQKFIDLKTGKVLNHLFSKKK